MREFVRGAPWWTEDGRVVRADPADRARLPGDTWERAGLPAGVRLEFTARGVRAVEIEYAASEPSPTDTYREVPPVFTVVCGAGTPGAAHATEATAARSAGATPAGSGAHGPESATDGVGHAAGAATAHGAGDTCAGRGTGSAYGAGVVTEALASPKGRTARLALPCPDGVYAVHLPEALRPALRAVRPIGGGTLDPVPSRPRWLVYGDSVAEGWSASRPHLTWPALAGRDLGVDTVNLGYAGAARGELASAEQLASLGADLITVAFGTNCWSRTPHAAGLLYETTRAFLTLVRRGHPKTPLLVVSPVLRPDAESTPNALGATLGELRAAMERAARSAGAALLPGSGLLSPGHLVDGVHPGDAGHRVIADEVASALRRGQPWAWS